MVACFPLRPGIPASRVVVVSGGLSRPLSWRFWNSASSATRGRVPIVHHRTSSLSSIDWDARNANLAGLPFFLRARH